MDLWRFTFCVYFVRLRYSLLYVVFDRLTCDEDGLYVKVAEKEGLGGEREEGGRGDKEEDDRVEGMDADGSAAGGGGDGGRGLHSPTSQLNLSRF